MAEEKLLALTIKVKGTTAEASQLAKLQGSVDLVKKEIKRLNDEEKRGVITAQEVAKRRSELTLQLKANQNAYRDLEATVLKNNDSLRKNSGFVEGIKTAIKGSIPSFTQLASSIGLAFGITEIAAFGKEAIGIALKAEGIERAFNKLNRKDFLNELRTATKGTVSDLELMQNAVKADKLGLPIERMATFLGFAQQRARETGESVDGLVQSIVTGIGRQSTLIIDNLGISSKRVSAEFKKTGDFALAVGNIIEEELTKSGTIVDGSADTVARYSAEWENLKLDIGKGFVEAGGIALDMLEFIGNGFESSADKAERFALKVKLSSKEMEIFGASVNNFQLAQLKKQLDTLLKFGGAPSEIAKVTEQINILEKKAGGDTQEALKKTIISLDLLEGKLSDLKTELGKSEIGSETFKALQSEIKKTQTEIDNALGRTDQKAIDEAKMAAVRFVLSDEVAATAEQEAQLAELDTVEKQKQLTADQAAADSKAAILDATLGIYRENKATETRIQQEELDKQLAQQQIFTDAAETLISGLTQAYIVSTSGQVDAAQKANRLILISFLDTIEKIVLAQVASATAQSLAQPDSVATFGATGIARAAIMTTLIKSGFAIIKSQILNSFAEGGIVPDGGGIISGPSHENGGVKFRVGNTMNEAQGGEPILVKEAGADPATRSILSAINVAHGGRAFANGGIVPAHKYALGGLTAPTPRSITGLFQSTGKSAEELLAIVDVMVDKKISKIKVVNTATDTSRTAKKVFNIQSDVSF